jgi:hypothetical protein
VTICSALNGKNYDETFLKQFPFVITSRDDIVHSNIINAPYICAWFLKKNYDYLVNLPFENALKTVIRFSPSVREK